MTNQRLVFLFLVNGDPVAKQLTHVQEREKERETLVVADSEDLSCELCITHLLLLQHQRMGRFPTTACIPKSPPVPNPTILLVEEHSAGVEDCMHLKPDEASTGRW
ncbi:hypothetical protein WG66_002322 [Moniliophthora roreri]|nr:hypothetical protein WG66_002322 [Moniliophthora roreri]